MRKSLTIGLFGFGCVGQGLYRVLNQSELLNASIKHIVVKDPMKQRSLPAESFKYDAAVILNDPSVNVVVELINDSEAALELVTQAMLKGKHVVSANKKLIADHLEFLTELAKSQNVSFLYEAAVGGSIPIIRNLEEYYNNDSLSGINGIVNGTTNYILTKVSEGDSFENALKKAQDLGFAELDASSDVDGFDAKYKLLILLKHAFGFTAKPTQLWNYGIRNLKLEDAAYAKEKGAKIKLIALGTKIESKIIGFVAPQLIPETHFAYSVDNEFNAVVLEALFSDRQLFLGKGAGSFPTASAVLSDISALQYDYAYEYKKSKEADSLSLEQDFTLKVYVSSTSPTDLNRIPFVEIEEQYQSAGFQYKIGRVRFSALSTLNLNEEKALFLAVYPDSVIPEFAVHAIKELELA